MPPIPSNQIELIKLVIAWSAVAAFVGILFVALLALAGKVTPPEWARKWILVSVLGGVFTLCLGAFTDVLHFNPKKVEEKIQQPLQEDIGKLVTENGELIAANQRLAKAHDMDEKANEKTFAQLNSLNQVLANENVTPDVKKERLVEVIVDERKRRAELAAERERLANENLTLQSRWEALGGKKGGGGIYLPAIPIPILPVPIPPADKKKIE